MEDIHDIKGLVPVPHYGWWCAGLVVLVLGGIAFWLWKRRNPGPVVPRVPPLTPFQAALAALLRLREGNLSVEEFYTRLSDIVRQYLEQQFRLHAPERTTEEFLYELSQGSQLTPAQKELLSSFLQESDLVKFAKLRPEVADRQRAFDAAEKFVRESVPTP
jgi:hypothetical protein